MDFDPEHEELLQHAGLSPAELTSLQEEYSDLQRRLRDDGFSANTVADVLRSLVYARTAPTDLKDAARSLRRALPPADLAALQAEGEKHIEGKMHRSVGMLVYDRYLRGNDSRLRRYFRSRGVADRDVMQQAVLRALIRDLNGQPHDEAAILKASGA